MPPEFLVVGHVVQDLISADDPGAWRLGGTAAFSSLMARNLGLRTAVLTAASDDVDLGALLPGIECRVVPSPRTTRIRNVYSDGRRHQFIPQRAEAIRAGDLPDDWRATPLVFLGPVAGEVDPALAAAFPRSLVAVGAQGWLREMDAEGRVRTVSPGRWQADRVLDNARALFVSDEDLTGAEAPAALKEWSSRVETVAFTHGDRGADICHRGEWRRIGAFPAKTVDPTGAGDIFAAGFLVRLHETGDVWEAARFGACAASFVVEGEGTAAIPSRERVEERLGAHPEIVCR